MVERQTDAKRIPLFPQRSLENIIPRSLTKLMVGTAFSSILNGTKTVVVISLKLWKNLFSSLGNRRSARGGSGNLARGVEWSFCLTAARMAAEQERG